MTIRLAVHVNGSVEASLEYREGRYCCQISQKLQIILATAEYE